jgi:hypothetical protein
VQLTLPPLDEHTGAASVKMLNIVPLISGVAGVLAAAVFVILVFRMRKSTTR